MKDKFDLVVIGGGSGGVRTARWSASLGAKVALIERDQMGGTCVIRGCVPKKIMAMAAHFKEEVNAMRAFGWETSGLSFDWSLLKKNRDHEVSRLSEIYSSLLKKAGVQTFKGVARFNNPNEVQVGEALIYGENIVLATGARPVIPSIPGSEHMISSDGFFELKTQPKRVVIVGGGYIGVELAAIFHGLGTSVDLIVRGAQLLSRFDHDLSDFLTENIKASGVRLHLEEEIQSIQRTHETLKISLRSGGRLECDVVVAATGRKPEVSSLGLEQLGMALEPDGRVFVNENMQTSISNIFAVGDVSNRVNLTPVATAEGMWISEYLFGSKKEPFAYENIPTAVFSNPPIATVGLSERECQVRHIQCQVFKTVFKPLKHTISGLEKRTLMKLVVEKDSQKVLGCHIAGEDAPEILQGFSVAVKMGATKAEFDATIGIHPTSAEELVTLR